MIRQTKSTYNRFAQTYHDYRTKEPNFFNTMIDIPAVLGLLGNVDGKSILDVGCGTGIYARLLQKRGAHICGIDLSEKMIEIARQESPEIDFRVAGASRLPFSNNTFHKAIAALVMHYMRDWNTPLQEIRRVLKPKGEFIFSIDNPVIDSRANATIHGKEYRILGRCKKPLEIYGNYFDECIHTGQLCPHMPITAHHKTYQTIIHTLLRNGFTITGYTDAKPLPKSKKLFPQKYEIYSRIPTFCVFRVQKT